MIIGDKKFQEYVRRCRLLNPLRISVTIRRQSAKIDGDACADTELLAKGVILIRIWKGMCKQATVDALLHEWTHAILCDDGYSDEDWMGHGPLFWTTFGEVCAAWEASDGDMT